MNHENFVYKSVQEKKHPNPANHLLPTKSADFSKEVSVRTKDKIPQRIWNYFEVSPHKKVFLDENQRLLSCQVLCHEIDEAYFKFSTLGEMKRVLELETFFQEHSLEEYLDLLRKENFLLRKREIKPFRVKQAHKIRNNQEGSFFQKFDDLELYALSDRGVNYKQWNQDALLIMPETKNLLVVDGMGGLSQGELASALCVDFVEYQLKMGMSIDQALVYANEAILTRARLIAGQGGKALMGAAFLAAHYENSELSICHMGDVKAIVIRNGKLVFETLDHTHGQDLLREGLVDQVTAKELNHILSRSLGMDHVHSQRDFEHNRVHLRQGDRLLFFTDGVSDNFYSKDFSLNELIRLVSAKESLDLICRKIWKILRHRMQVGSYHSHLKAKGDNFSFILAEKR